MRKIIILLTCFAINSVCNAQSKEESSFKLSAVSINYGTLLQNTNSKSSLNTFRKIIPNSDLLKRDFSQFSESTSINTSANGPTLDLNLIFSKKDGNDEAKKLNPEYRIGLSYSTMSVINYRTASEEKYRLDTLQSSQNNNSVFVDSLYFQNYSFAYEQELLYLTVGVNISSNPLRALGVFVGGEFGFGYSLNSNIIAGYSDFSIVQSSDGSFVPSTISYDNNFEDESFKVKNSFATRLAIPFGFSYRFNSKLNESSINETAQVFLETRPSLSFHNIPEVGVKTSFSYLFGLGFRYDF